MTPAPRLLAAARELICADQAVRDALADASAPDHGARAVAEAGAREHRARAALRDALDALDRAERAGRPW